ncbi:MAG: carboxypeptidase-like regulatory domain-containing protein, partial [Desulfobulbaceae bacterium]|nr:carboxypeptidase-like regulatory domain-containing protein [Desulfobulbaceae bacterium]
GGAASGPLTVQLPTNIPWLTLGSNANLPSLAPGEKATINLLLNPGQDLPLDIYRGSLNVLGTSTHATVNFQFRAVSEAVGDVKVTVTDEYTYFAENAPNLTGATVQLLDAYTSQVVATAITDDTGVVTFIGVAEGPYTLQASATKHDTVRQSVYVTPGGLVDQELFLHRQAVSYNWTVVPTEIQDHYKIVLETTFETEVPMPVVTVDEPFLMPMVLPGYTTQFSITMRNHGLINATQVRIDVPNDPDYIITPLITEIPVLAAKSEMTIPVTIRLSDAGMAKLNATGGDIQSAGPARALTKCLGLGVVYTYECKDGKYQRVPVQLAATVGCLEGFSDAAGSISTYLLERAMGNLLGAGCDVISMALDCYTAATGNELLDDCQTAILTTACKALAGGLAAGPAGALASAASNWSDILACLCSIDWGGSGSSSSSSGSGSGGWGGWGGYGGAGSPYGVPTGYTSYLNNCSGTSSASAGEEGDIITSGDTALTTQSGGVCAEVRLRLEQEAVITRTAFLGTLELNNGRSDTSLEDIRLTLDIRDAAGNDANDMFLLRGPVLDNISEVNGQWVLGPSTNGTIQYTFVPTNDAAPDEPVLYYMGGTLHYVENGTVVDVPL